MSTIQLVHSYDAVLFVGSVLIAAFASYVALCLVGRVSAAEDADGRGYVRWLAAASAAMGVGIWSMHFTGMLAMRLPVPVGYDLRLTLLSAAIAVGASLLALRVVRRESVSTLQLAGAALLMGVAIAGMHYTGMAAMRVPGEMYYRPELVAASVGIAVAASGAALWLTLAFRGEETTAAQWGKLSAGVVMGLAVSGMHYTGMAAAGFGDLRPDAPLSGGLLFTDGLATGVAIGSLVVLGLGLIAAQFDRRLHGAYTSDLREAKRRYETILTEISDVVTVLDEEGTIRYESPSVARVFGYDPTGRVGRSAWDHVHPDDLEPTTAAFAALLGRPGRPETLRYRLRAADGSWRRVESTGIVPDHEALGPVVVTRDITDRYMAERKYRAIFDTNPSAVGLATLEEGRFVEVNEGFELLLGHRKGAVVGKTVAELGLWAHPEEREQVVFRLREVGTVRNREVNFRKRDGQVVAVLFSGSLLTLEGEDYLLAVAQDISERKAFEAELEHRALHDGLTDLPNRVLFRDRLRQALDRSRREGTQVAVLFLNADRFKAINDSLGHAAGDRVLGEISTRLVDSLREADTVARVGGDEFAVLLEGLAGPDEIERTARRIQRAFDPPFVVDGNEFSLTVSIGVAHSGLSFEDPDDLVRLADAAMYRVKGPGLTDYHVFDPDRDQAVTQRLQREAALRRAIQEGEFTVHFQPIVCLATGAFVGAEALARWEEPGRGLVLPGEFIPLAEVTGLIVPLGREVLRLALGQAKRWREAGLVAPDAFRVAVNLSAREYQEEDLVESVLEAARSADVPLSMLTLEITETVAVTGRDPLKPLRKAGLRLAIDDFGTGYSSLAYLRDLEADTVKVDRSFISGLGRRRRDETIVRAILLMAREMGLDSVAEGVETPEQAEWLREVGCQEAQGYHFCRPLPPAEFEELLAARTRPGAVAAASGASVPGAVASVPDAVASPPGRDASADPA